MKTIASLALALILGFAPAAFAVERFDLNKATVEQLMSIPDANISEDMAKDWIAKSKEKPFVFPEDLFQVKGFDNKALERINPLEEDGTLWFDPNNEEMLLAPSKC